MHSGFEGEILSFAPPSMGLSGGAHPQAAPTYGSFAAAGSSQNISNLTFQTPITPSSILGSPFAFEQQGAVRNGRSQSRSIGSLNAGTMTTLVYSVLISDSNELSL